MLRAAFAAVTVPAVAFAQAAHTPRLGEKWVGADGNQREARIGLYVDRRAKADPELVRGLEINWRDFPYQQGTFPTQATEEDQSAQIGIQLEVDAAGVPGACRIVESSGLAAFDDHVCPHLLRYLRFYPALNRTGQRLGGTLSIRVSYFAGRVRMQRPGGGTIPVLWRPTPRPLAPIDSIAIGFGPDDGLPDSVGGISGWLRVEADGSVSACLLAAPTQIDSADIGICERLRAWKFEPARDRNGRIVASDYSFGVARPR